MSRDLNWVNNHTSSMEDKGSKSKYLGSSQKITETTIDKKLKRCKNGDVGTKGCKVFSENYVHNVYRSDNTNESYLPTGLCHRSQRKNEPQHKMRITVKVSKEYARLAIHFALSKQGLNHFHHYCRHKRWRTRNLRGLKHPCPNK